MRNRIAVALALACLWLLEPSAFFHFELLKSKPAAKASLTAAPARLQLWFSQVPAAGVSVVTLRNDTGDIAVSGTTIVAKDKSMYADPVKPLTVGKYTIHWRGAGDDGHVQQGDILFTVSAK